MDLCNSQTGFSGSGLSKSFSLHVASQSLSVSLSVFFFFPFHFFNGRIFFTRIISSVSFQRSPTDNVWRYLRWGTTSGWMSTRRRGCWGSELRYPTSDNPSAHGLTPMLREIPAPAAVFSLCSTDLRHPSPAFKGSTKDDRDKQTSGK